MDQIYLTKNALEDLFQRVTMAALGYDPTDPALADKVRISWPTGGAPAWGIDEDVCFLRLNFQPQPIDKQIDSTFEPKDNDYTVKVESQTRVLYVSWIFYGPNSYDNAFKLRYQLYQDSIKDELKKVKIYLVPSVDAPIRAPELYTGQWWERSDLSAPFNELVKFANDIPFLKSADIQIINDRGGIRNVHIEP